MSALSNPSPSPSPIQQPPKRVVPVSPQEPERKKSGWKGWLILAIVIAAGWAGYEFGLKPQQQRAAARQAAVIYRTTKVVVGPFERTLRIGGVTSALKYSNVTAPRIRGFESGSQMELLTLAKSGAWVSPGEVLAQIDPGTLNDHVDDLKATIEQSDLDVKKREAEQGVEMENLSQTLRVAQASVNKARLDNQAAEVRTDIERELLKLSLEEAEAKNKQSQLDIPEKKTVHAAEIKILGFTKERHVRHHARHTNDIKAYTMRSSMKGMVVLSSTYRGGGESRQIQTGDQIMPGQPLMKIVDPASMQVEATINQAESMEIRIGQMASIGFDAFPGLALKGKVYSIGALAAGGWRQNYFIRSVPVRLTIEGVDPKLIPDLSAFADVVLEKKENSTLAPLEAIHEENGKNYVYLKQGEQWVRKEVTLGASNNLYAVVTAGLSGGEEVRVKN
jgi:multidrug efflux pump subunit AcrA (membrane-fusion protein)